jgi:hypothetical protein
MTRHRKPRSPIDPRASRPDLYDTFSALPHYKLASLAAALEPTGGYCEGSTGTGIVRGRGRRK